MTATSTPNFGINDSNNAVVAVDANGNLAAGDFGGNIAIYTAPLSGASTPSASFKNGTATNNEGIAFLPNGDFWATTLGNRINRFNAPFSNASTPAASITHPALVFSNGIAFDSAQNMYVTNAPGGNVSSVFVFAPPYTGAPIITPSVPASNYRGAAVRGTQLFVANVGAGASNGWVDVYNLPITAASIPAFSIIIGMSSPEGVAFDAAGNLYAGHNGNETITVYSPPFSAASSPTLTFAVPGVTTIYGLAIGT